MPIFRVTVLLMLFFLGGCLSVQNENQLYELEMISGTGDYDTAYRSARKTAKKKNNSHHRLLWKLHEGYLGYWANEPLGSIEAFRLGATYMQSYEDRPTVSARTVGSQMLSLVTETGTKPYRGSVVDGVLLHTYKALSHAQNFDLSSALAEMRQAGHRRKMAHDHYRRQIEGASKRKDSLPGGWRQRSEIRESVEDAYGDTTLLPHYMKFTNPFQVHLEAIFSSHHGSAQNREHSRKLYSTLLSMNAKQPLISRYRQWAASRYSDSSIHEPVIHVIHERGRAPVLVNDSISVTLPIRGEVTGIHLAFPSLLPLEDETPQLRLTGSDNTDLFPIASLDQLIIAERKTKDLPILIEQIGSALSKALIENRLAQENELLGLGMTLFNSAINRADTRSWTTLPKLWEGTMLENHGTPIRFEMGKKSWAITPPSSDQSYLLHMKSTEDPELVYHWIPLDPQ